jgi:hypothetical protein
MLDSLQHIHGYMPIVPRFSHEDALKMGWFCKLQLLRIQEEQLLRNIPRCFPTVVDRSSVAAMLNAE